MTKCIYYQILHWKVYLQYMNNFFILIFNQVFKRRNVILDENEEGNMYDTVQDNMVHSTTGK